ncbi:MAG: helix-turn-helix domain-containing protein [Armatimonadetes bacterium]|nr:helix-turn-helix domain-containing protein [Armatimonadota bacterium]
MRERTAAGLVAARARGRKEGWPRTMDERQARMAQALREDPALSVAEICRRLGVSEATVCRYSRPASDGNTQADALDRKKANNSVLSDI